jgi:hypothetical protein
LSVAALRRARTTLRKKISKGELTFGEDEATVLSIMDAASNDIATGLRAAGKGNVANEFKAVDAAYRDRMQFIQGTLQKIVGKRGANLPAERVFANLKAMASPKGDMAGLARIMREATPEEQGDIAATFAEGLGKNKDGNFSIDILTGHIERIPPAARAAIFGQEGAKSLANVAILAKEAKRVNKALGGSPTGAANDYRSWAINLLIGPLAGLGTQSTVKGVAIGGAAAAAKAGRDALAARALMSPKITGWLRSAPKTSDPKAINAHIDRLKAIAVREPALAPVVQDIEQIIMRAANENVTPGVAASESE